MIDTHAHLDACEAPDEVLVRAREAGVSRVIAIGSGIPSCRRTLQIAEGEEGVAAALGIHPHQAGEAGAAELSELRELLDHPQAVAVGETGLDHFRDHAPRDDQRRLFEAQAALAAELGRPLVVHSRAAAEDTLAVLRGLEGPVVLHCFSSAELLEPALAQGWYVSFAGNVTYPKASELRWAAAQAPRERLLAETDSPYLAPQPVRGRPNEPANVTYTVAALAEAREEDVGELERVIDENAARVFGP